MRYLLLSGLLLLALALVWTLIERHRRRWGLRLARPNPGVPARVHHAWRAACQHLPLHTSIFQTPTITAHRPVPAGDLVTVTMPSGWPVATLADQVEPLASFLRAREVRVTRDLDDAGRAEVLIARRDPLATPLADPWPWLRSGRLDLWAAGIPIGIDDLGDLVRLPIIERNVLLGGEPGAGKSAAASMLVAAAALDPTVRLILCDGALVELAVWRHCAERFVGPDPTEFLTVLQELQAEMDRRLHRLVEMDRRKVAPGDGMPLIVVPIDELAFYLNTGNRKLDEQISAALRDLVARGRKTGIIVVACTQKPSSDVIPTSIRDLFAVRWALRVTTPDASDTILGRGWAHQGYSAHTIDVAARGVGWLLAEGALPRRLRTYYLTDAQLAELAATAATLRAAEGPPLGEVA
jgi:FtsK/SpoIIIE family